VNLNSWYLALDTMNIEQARVVKLWREHYAWGLISRKWFERYGIGPEYSRVFGHELCDLAAKILGDD